MMTVGLTGGIGSGKTTVAKMFAARGIPVYNSDERAGELMHSSEKLKSGIKSLLGEHAYLENKLNRGYIAGRVFDDSKLLDQLNKLVHPAVKKDFKKWAARQRAPYVIQEAAILFENGSYTEYDRIILVTAPEETRIARIVHRPGSSKKDIKARMRNQWEDSRKEALAHFTIVNTDMEKTQVAVDTIHAKLLKTTD